jgi:hypothetical protein
MKYLIYVILYLTVELIFLFFNITIITSGILNISIKWIICFLWNLKLKNKVLNKTIEITKKHLIEFKNDKSIIKNKLNKLL